MMFNKAELRNKENNLLRRVQRQVDKKNQLSFEDFKVKKERKNKMLNSFTEGFGEDEVEEEFVKCKGTKLGLFNKRRWERE